MKLKELRKLIREEIDSPFGNNSEIKPLGFILTYKGLPCNITKTSQYLFIHIHDEIRTKSDISYFVNSKKYWESKLREIEQYNLGPENVSIEYKRTPLNEDYDFNYFNIKEIKVIY